MSRKLQSYPMFFLVFLIFNGCQDEALLESGPTVLSKKHEKLSILKSSEIPEIVEFIKSQTNENMSLRLRSFADSDTGMRITDSDLEV